ncbi:MAG: alpha/beta hydrolase-fold protein [Aestuariibaculum sp.]
METKINSQETENTTSEQTVTWNKAYGGADKAYDTELLKFRDEIAPKFQTLEFKDSITGKTMAYNLYIPKNYDKSKTYPLVLFMADGSTTGKGTEAPLKQGYGGIIWATDESQSENPSFVLVPSYVGPENVVNDNWETSEEVDITLRLLKKIVSEYLIDQNRLYTTGQSMGGMISFYLNATNKDLFAASIFVGSQWDISVLKPLVNEKFFYIVSAGDPKASKGMMEVGKLLTQNGVKFGKTEFSVKLPQIEQEQKIRELLKADYPINFVEFTIGTVGPNGSTDFSEHMYSFDYAYKLKSVRDWLFKQTKNSK